MMTNELAGGGAAAPALVTPHRMLKFKTVDDPAVTVNVVPDPETVAIDGLSDVAVNALTPVSLAVNVCVGCGDGPAADVE